MLKTLQEVKILAERMWYSNGYLKGDDKETREMWINGFSIGYLQRQLDDMNEDIEKNMGRAIGRDFDNR